MRDALIDHLNPLKLRVMCMSISVQLNHSITRNSDIIEANIEGETIMMSITNGQYYELVSTAARIWDMIKEPKVVADICSELNEAYDVGREQCEHDVIHFLNHLAELNVVKVDG